MLHAWLGRGTHRPWPLQHFGSVTLVVDTSFGAQGAEGPSARLRNMWQGRIGLQHDRVDSG